VTPTLNPPLDQSPMSPMVWLSYLHPQPHGGDG
jgi:hypothetical protein